MILVELVVGLAATTTAPRTAVCLVGQPRSLELTAVGLRAHLLDHLDADAFVIAHTESELEPTFEEIRDVRQRIGSRIVYMQMTAGPVNQSNWTDWAVHGHPLSQWSSRRECAHAITNIEAARGVSYKIKARVRMDMLLLAPVSTRLLAPMLKAVHGSCEDGRSGTALIPSGEDYGGLNDRMLFGDACAFAADSSILDFMTTLGGRHIREGWDVETAHQANLRNRGVAVLRTPMAGCLLDVDGSCKLRGELVHAAHHVPRLLETWPHLCGALMLRPSARDGERCNPRRHTFVGPDGELAPLIADAPMRSEDPGFCILERRCRAAAAARMLCLGDGALVEDGILIRATAPCNCMRTQVEPAISQHALHDHVRFA